MEGASNIVLVGPMGAGKSVAGALLARRLGLGFVDVDAAVEAEAGARIGELFRRDGEAAFRARETAALARCLAGDGRVVATGGGAVLDAGNRQRLRERGVVAWLQADPATQLRRLECCDDRPLLEGADREARLRALAAERDPLYREVADVAVDTRGLDAAGTAEAIAARIAGRWRAPAPEAAS
ncbi:MAG: shikimate kinase [Luteimonas sp.]